MKTNYDVKLGSKVAIIGVRDFYQLGEKVRKLLKKHDINATLINPKYVAHLDTETLTSLMANHELVVTLEDNTLESGFGEKIASYYGPNNMNANFPGFYNSNHTADRFSASRISFMHDFPETRGSQLWFGYFYQ